MFRRIRKDEICGEPIPVAPLEHNIPIVHLPCTKRRGHDLPPFRTAHGTRNEKSHSHTARYIKGETLDELFGSDTPPPHPDESHPSNRGGEESSE